MLMCLRCSVTVLSYMLSPSEQLSGGITAPARAHVSITANRIISQCACLKVFLFGSI